MKKYKPILFNFIKVLYFVAVFIVACIFATNIFSQGTDDMTAEMGVPTLPVINIRMGDLDINYMYGYTGEMECAYMRDSLSVIGADRKLEYSINTYGNRVRNITFEVRNINGDRLIENTEILNYTTVGDYLNGQITVKDLISSDEEYMMVFVLELDGGVFARYYSRLIWAENLHVEEKLSFVDDFCRKTFDKEAATELAKYMETNSSGDNSSFHSVNIHSNFKQLTWGDLDVELINNPRIMINDLTASTGYFIVNYQIQVEEESGKATCNVTEYYRIRYTSDRIYLLNWERECDQIFDENNTVYSGNQIELGITGSEIEIAQSDGGNIFAFVDEGKLISVNASEGKVARIFSFYTDDLRDLRVNNRNHDIHILNVDENGNVIFLVYGYMNRGSHEGKVGLALYEYNSNTNTTEEKAFVKYNKAPSLLRKDISQLSYVDREGNVYFMQERAIYKIDTENKALSVMASNLQDDSFKVSDSGKMVVWQNEGDVYSCTRLRLMNLTTGISEDIKVGYGEYIIPLGFINEDLAYGLAKTKDVKQDLGGATVFPIYKLIIRNDHGETLKEYSQPDSYIMDYRIENGQLYLDRAKYNDKTGLYEAISPDQIMSATQAESENNHINMVVTENLETICQIAMKDEIDKDSIIHQTPRDIIFEDNRELVRNAVEPDEIYYVYGLHGYMTNFFSVGNAVNYAYDISGMVIDKDGQYVWKKTNRATKNQIMAITEPEVEQGELAVAECIDAMLRFEGITTNSRILLAQGQSAQDILENNMSDKTILNLTGCNLDTVLYYVNQDIPVLTILNDSSAMLITGFNDSQVVLFDPTKGELRKENSTDVDNNLRKNGYRFITYIK